MTKRGELNNNYRHGLRNHPFYKVWAKMKERCYNKNCPEYKDYGGRGIIICKEWSDNFKSFYEWGMLNGWEPGLQIDRFPDNNGNYEPGNCRFVTAKENSRNRRSNRKIEFKGETKLLCEWAETIKIPYNTLFNRLKNMPIEKALTRPRVKSLSRN